MANGDDVQKLELLWSLVALRSQMRCDTVDLDSISNQHDGRPHHQYLRSKWFFTADACCSKDIAIKTSELTTTGLLVFSVIAASQGNQKLRDSLQVALTIMSAKDHDKYFQCIPVLNAHRTMFRAYVDFCLKFCNVWNGKDKSLNQDYEVIVVWSQLLEPLGEMLNLLFIDHLQNTSSQWLMNIPKPVNIEGAVEHIKSRKPNGVYEQFHKYNFTQDQRFQSGLQQILSRFLVEGEPAQNSEDLLVQAKLFYFSRFYYEVGLDGYERWLKEKCKDTYVPVPKNDGEGMDSESEESRKQDDGRENKDHAIKVGNQNISENVKEEENANTNEKTHEENKIVFLPEENGQMSDEILVEPDRMSMVLTDEEKVQNKGNESSRNEERQINNVDEAERNAEEESNAQLVGSSLKLTHAVRNIDEHVQTIPLNNDSNFPYVNHDHKQDGVGMATCGDYDASIYPTTFMELLQLVQEGKEIPGIEKLMIVPTNSTVTESRMERTVKPWQK